MQKSDADPKLASAKSMKWLKNSIFKPKIFCAADKFFGNYTERQNKTDQGAEWSLLCVYRNDEPRRKVWMRSYDSL